jgi:hypothetical protein
MIRIIPHTAQVQFDETFTAQILIDKIYDKLESLQILLINYIKERDLDKIKNSTKQIDQLCMLINTAKNYLDPIEYEFCKDKIMPICDFQKDFFDEFDIIYSTYTEGE